MSEGDKLTVFPKRKAIPNGVRFEVFKRDAFTCQYCGSKAPDVVLNIDHIKPVADGGENEIINLITSCFNCNSGKSDIALDDDAAIQKQRKQLEDLNERRTQLEMMVSWREGMSGIEEDYFNAIQKEFLDYSSFSANETGAKEIRRWLKKYTFNEVFAAVGKSFSQYIVTNQGETVESNSWERAFKMVPRIIEADRRGGISSEKMRIYYCRGILRRTCRWIDEKNVVSLIQDAVDAGADIELIIDLAKKVTAWRQFDDNLTSFIESKGNEEST